MKTVRLRLVSTLLLTTLCGAFAWPVDYPLAVADGADFSALLQDPSEISFTVDTAPPASASTASIGDLHAVYPVPIDALRRVVTDYNSYPEFSPRVSRSQATRIGEQPSTWRQRLTLSFRVLFFGSDYDYYLEVVEQPLGPDRFAICYRMDESLDGRLSDVAGSWFLQAVEIDGEEHTYVRYFNSIYFAQDQFGLRVALRNLGARDLKMAMDAFYQEAERRMRE